MYKCNLNDDDKQLFTCCVLFLRIPVSGFSFLSLKIFYLPPKFRVPVGTFRITKSIFGAIWVISCVKQQKREKHVRKRRAFTSTIARQSKSFCEYKFACIYFEIIR